MCCRNQAWGDATGIGDIPKTTNGSSYVGPFSFMPALIPSVVFSLPKMVSIQLYKTLICLHCCYSCTPFLGIDDHCTSVQLLLVHSVTQLASVTCGPFSTQGRIVGSIWCFVLVGFLFKSIFTCPCFSLYKGKQAKGVYPALWVEDGELVIALISWHGFSNHLSWAIKKAVLHTDVCESCPPLSLSGIMKLLTLLVRSFIMPDKLSGWIHFLLRLLLVFQLGCHQWTSWRQRPRP